jgi:hypothetical protein
MNAHALVVVESMWGNTRAVAEAVARGLGEGTEVVDVTEAPTTLPAGVTVLVVGGPTHAFSMTRQRTRDDAERRGAPAGRTETGLREWLDEVASEGDFEIATFDTRIESMKRLPGSAAKAASRYVRRHHLGRVIGVESFYVSDTEGPLLPGELERAEAWGRGFRARLGIR